jgi:hypothetical protein
MFELDDMIVMICVCLIYLCMLFYSICAICLIKFINISPIFANVKIYTT